jgi:16S rRNA pseudouridine516 synthase
VTPSASRPQPHRVDQILSRYGYCTRREARDWIRQRRVTVDGEPVRAPDQKVLVSSVLVDLQPIEFPDGLLVLLHKPAGCVCSHEDREGPTIYGELPARWRRRNPPITSIGRLDRDTTGVLLLTDLGALVQQWTSPRHKVPKIYDVTVDRDLRSELIDIFAAGTLLLEQEEHPCHPARLSIQSPRQATLELTEGRYHQVKRMFARQGYTVTRLHRSRFGPFELAGLKPGEWRVLSPDAALQSAQTR